MSPDNEGRIANSLKELGQFKPIVVRDNPDPTLMARYEILGGEHRWREAVKAGATEIMCLDLGAIDDIKAKKISLADNARYGVDDVSELARLLEDIGGAEAVQAILPYSDADLTTIFAASDIALDELELPESYEAEPAEPASAKAPKTHTIMRFKVSLGDAEKITEIVTKVQKRQGLTDGDELMRAGDALAHLLLTDSAPEDE